jgi:hypothetical protein
MEEIEKELQKELQKDEVHSNNTASIEANKTNIGRIIT